MICVIATSFFIYFSDTSFAIRAPSPWLIMSATLSSIAAITSGSVGSKAWTNSLSRCISLRCISSISWNCALLCVDRLIPQNPHDSKRRRVILLLGGCEASR